MSKTLNKGRDYYRRLQAECRAKANNPRYPEPESDRKHVRLSDRRYHAINIRTKPYEVMVGGKKEIIRYQTCTLVRAAVEVQAQ